MKLNVRNDSGNRILEYPFDGRRFATVTIIPKIYKIYLWPRKSTNKFIKVERI